MAKLSLKLPDKLIKGFENLGSKTDEVCEKVLEVGAKVVFPVLKSNLQAAVGKGTKFPSRSTGELVNSLGISPVKNLGSLGFKAISSATHDIKIGFNEPRKKQYKPKKMHLSRQNYYVASRGYYKITNALLANIIEYGKSGQPPRPFMRLTRRQTFKPCILAMQSALGSEVNKIWGS